MRVQRDQAELQGLLEALGAAIIWGFAFITLRWSVQAFGPIWSRAFSFVLVAGAVLPIALLTRRGRRRLSLSQFFLASLPGCALGLSLCLQSAGISSTTVANSGFITVLYIVLIPFGERAFYGQRLAVAHWAAVALALLGAGLLCGGLPTQWSTGDLLTLGCAIIGACHFLLIQRVARNITSPFFFNVLQVFWAGLATLPFAWYWVPLPASFPNMRAVASLGFLAFGSIMIGFMLQVRAQRVLSSTVASLICLLEGPIAAVFAYLILDETMGMMQCFGALIVLAAATLAAIVPLPKTQTS